jgi:UDP-glucose 4-epimerase
MPVGPMNRTCWITGASGFIGNLLFMRLAADGFRVAGVDIVEPPADRPGHSVTAPLGQSALDRLAERTGPPDIVYHFAGGSAVGPSFMDPLEDFNRAVPPTAELIEWLRRSAPRARLLFASSAAVYGNRHLGPIPETTELAPVSPYGVHKAVCEELLRGAHRVFGLDTVTTRIFSVYGAGLRKQILFDSCVKLAASPTLVLGGTGCEVRHFIDCDDLLSALITATERAGPGQTINVAGSEPIRMEQVAAMTCEAWQKVTGEHRAYAFSGASRPGDPLSLVAERSWMEANCSSFKPLELGVLSYVEWFCRTTAYSSPRRLVACL